MPDEYIYPATNWFIVSIRYRGSNTGGNLSKHREYTVRVEHEYRGAPGRIVCVCDH